ncbi:MAG: glutaminyl-tRNA synthase (glutamine-hydrolyzing) subunit A [Candidatus Altiarchaeales archaeon A3]|nr:MAG: glutaminyl-tRNA synthase (glutamine-hydrolyzing) subunit A [Candidatus Altiarchaeales archaeon A3]
MEISEIKEKDKKINAFIAFNEKFKSEEERQKGNLTNKGKLEGLKIGVKSNMNVIGLKITCASKTLENYLSFYDATVVERVKQNHGLIVGMTNMDEFACGSSGETSYFGATQNPSALGHIPGGSSSGSAAAVAAGFVDCALGSDTGGSIRNPASHCGIVGFKPTYGVVSRYGLIDLAMSLDQIGPMAKDVQTASLLLEVIAGQDGKDATCLNLDKNFCNFYKNLDGNLKNLKFGYAKEFDELISDAGIKNVIHKGIDKISSAGCEIVDVSLPDLNIALPTYYLNVYVEFFSATRKLDGRRYGYKIEDVCGEEVLRRIILGKFISQKENAERYYRKAIMARTLLKKEISEIFKNIDVLLSPTVPKLPHKIGEKISDPRVMYAYDIFTVLANLAGIPAGVVPAGKVDGIPTGLQFMGKALNDQKVLNAMYGFENLK